MVVVTAGIIERDGQILIAQRKKGSRPEYKRELPGEKLEEGARDALTSFMHPQKLNSLGTHRQVHEAHQKNRDISKCRRHGIK